MKWSYYKIKTEAISKVVDRDNGVSIIDLIAEGLDCPEEDINLLRKRMKNE